MIIKGSMVFLELFIFCDILLYMSIRVLGFDISSTCIGYCVLDIEPSNNIKFVHADYFKPTKKGDIMDRIIDTRNAIKNIIDTYQPDYIGIEDLIKFMPKSTATTVVVLTTFNRMICLLANDYLKNKPSLFNVLTIRHGLKINKQLPKKEDMPELVAKHLGITFPYKRVTKGKNKGAIAIESFDMADGVAVALYHA